MWTTLQYLTSHIQGQRAVWAVDADSWAPGNPGWELNTTIDFREDSGESAQVKAIKNVIKVRTDLRATIPVAVKVVFVLLSIFVLL